jgi:hypothetical protein
MKKSYHIAVVGGTNLRPNDKWINQLAIHLEEQKADEVVITGTGGGSLIGELAAAKLYIPNVILSGQKLVDRADKLIALPGGYTARSYVRMFGEAGKPVVIVEDGE